MSDLLPPLPARTADTREALRSLACFVIAPARKAQTGRIGLRPTGDGFGTPLLPDGTRIVVRGDHLAREPGGEAPITTLQAAATFVGTELSPDPGVGHDLPPFDPDTVLPVDADASWALGSWFSFGQQVLDRLASDLGDPVSEAQLWPEHFDLAVVVDTAGGVNVGFSPGDAFSSDPYLYVGPHSTESLTGEFWNAPFGAFATYDSLRADADPLAAALHFVGEGLRRA